MPHSGRLFALALAGAALVTIGCSTRHRANLAAQRAEEAVERSTVVPRATPPPEAPSPPPASLRRVAAEWPTASIPGALARSLSALASAEADGSGRRREVLRALEVHFAAGALELDSRARALLDEFAARLNLGDAFYILEIQGHTDASGTTTANLAVGLRRAEAVRRHLLAATAIPAERIGIVSLGSGRPAGDDSTPAGRAANRRVVVLALR